MKPHRRITWRILFLAAATIGWSVAIYAQTVTGTLQGTVTDTTGAVVPGAEVVVRNVETGQERNLKTNSDGSYSAAFLPLGQYTATASGKGFGKVVQEKIEITINQTRVIDFTLSPVGVAEAVTITADAAPINTTNAEVKGSLNTQEILDKPTFNPGSFLTLAETFTGFQENPTSGQNNPTASSGSSINFNGTGTRGATFQINGVNNDDSSENQNRQGASLSTIAAFQVITNNFTAEFGRGYGAVVLVQTKSGTNNIHGDLYEFHNDSALNAKSHFFTAQPKPVTRRNQYGFTAGFPIFKNHLFGFISFDQKRESGAINVVRDLLTAQERTQPLTLVNDTPANRAFVQSVIARFANVLPNDPSSSARTFRGQRPFNRPLDDYSGRLDWNPREADNFFARWQYTRQIFDNSDSVVLGEATRQNNKQQNIGFTWTHLFSAKTVGEFRYGLGLRTTLVGIKAGNDTPIIQFTNLAFGTPTIGSAGNFPINRYQTDNQFVYNVTTLFGNHFFKAGTDMRRQKLNDLADDFSRGFYSFSRTCGGTTLATGYDQFLRGCISSYTKGFGPFFLENRINESNFYGEDNWKLRPNLTLNIGARYEYVSAPREVKNRIDYVYGADKDNVEPRFGFAYSPGWTTGFITKLTGGPGASSIRGGYGFYHGRIFQSIFSQGGANVRFNPPNAARIAFSGPSGTGSFNVADPTEGFVFTPGVIAGRPGITLIDPKLEMPYTRQWTLTFERQIPFNSALRLTYTGNRGIGLLRYVQQNLPISPLDGPVLVPDHPNNPANLRGQSVRLAADAQCAGTNGTTIEFTTACPSVVPIAFNEVSLRVPRSNERRPDPRFGANLQVGNGAFSDYSGLQVEWIKRLSQGISFQMAYTWSHSLDTTSEATFVGAGDSNATGPNTKIARGNSRFDTRHRMTFNGSYLLPFLRRRTDWIGTAFGGWQISSVIKLVSGTPFTVIGGSDLNLDSFAERPALLDPSVLGRGIDNPATSQQQLPASAFRRPLFGDLGAGNLVGRNTFFTDGVQNVDFGLYKSFRMPWEGQKFTLRAEFYNAFNHVQYGFPTSTDISSVNFGRITGTSVNYNPRTIQLALRYQF